MFKRVHAHPARAVRLLEPAAGRQRRAAVEDADVVEPEEAAFEDVRALGVLPVHPPGEVQHQFLEYALEEEPVTDATAFLLDLVDTPCGPRVHRRVHVAQRPLVRWKLAVRMHVPLAQEQHELFLGELGVDDRERHAVEGQIPGGVPRVLPLVRHRDHVGVIELRPRDVPALQTFGRRRRRCGIPFEPFAHDVVVELLRPQQPGNRLAHHGALVVSEGDGNDRGEVLVGLIHAAPGTRDRNPSPRRGRGQRPRAAA